jgi:hypothetical protein
MMFAELMRFAQFPRWLAMCTSAATMSFLMMSQQDLKKAPMKPSGPGDFVDVWLMSLWLMIA